MPTINQAHLEAWLTIRPWTKDVLSQELSLLLSETGMQFSPRAVRKDPWQQLVGCQGMNRHPLTVAAIGTLALKECSP